MKITVAITSLCCLAAIGFVWAQEGSQTVWDGVYTEVQAKRGEAVYQQNCIRCHGPTLMGGTDGAGPLVGPTFNGNWNGVLLGDMVERIRLSMPQDKPGTLSRKQIADVLAFVLVNNKFPPGTRELARQTELLNQIRFQARKP